MMKNMRSMRKLLADAGVVQKRSEERRVKLSVSSAGRKKFLSLGLIRITLARQWVRRRSALRRLRRLVWGPPLAVVGILRALKRLGFLLKLRVCIFRGVI